MPLKAKQKKFWVSTNQPVIHLFSKLIWNGSNFGPKPSDTLATLLKNDGVEGMEEYIGPRNQQRKKKGAEDSASEASTPAASAEAAPAAEAPKTEEAPKEEEKPAEEPKAEEAPAEEPPKEEEKPAEETPKE